MRLWKGIIIHHSLTKDSDTVSWGAIKDYHLKQGFKDIGYHFGLEYVDGKIKLMRGRSTEEDGAHTKGKNKDYIGICLVGNYDITEPTEDMYSQLAILCRELMERNGFDMDAIHGHFNFAEKTCPGRNFNWMKFARYLMEA